MKRVCNFIFLAILCTSFSVDKTKKAGTRYAFVVDVEYDWSFDKGPKSDPYGKRSPETRLACSDCDVFIITDVIAYNCNISDNNIKYQFNDHYEAFERTKTRHRNINTTNLTYVWTYSSYDEAVSKRREYMAGQGSRRKRVISNFNIICK
jgi:hypothetical protein